MKQKYKIAHIVSALNYAQLSTATRLKVGCVVVKDDTIIGIGYNGTPPGWDNVCEVDNKTKPEVFHAEQNALDKITKSTISAVGAVLFITHAPCMECAKRILGAGVVAVYYTMVYRTTEGVEFLIKAGIHVEQIPHEDQLRTLRECAVSIIKEME